MAAKVKALQQWCKFQCEGYRDVEITNMTSSWKSGLAFCAIIHKYRPELIDYDSLSRENVFENNKLAFDVAKQLGIPALLDPEDMVAMTVPDKLCIVTYVSQYYNYFKNYRPVTSMKRRFPDDASSSDIAKKPVLHSSVGQIALQNSMVGDIKSSNDSTSSIKRHTMGDTCNVCNAKVYLMERQIEGDKLYHRHCLRNLQKMHSSTLQLSCTAALTDKSNQVVLDQNSKMKLESMENEDNSVEVEQKKHDENQGPNQKYLSPATRDESCYRAVGTVSQALATVHTGDIISKIALREDRAEPHEEKLSVCSTIVTSVCSNVSSSDRSAVVTNLFTQPKQSATTCVGQTTENFNSKIAHISSSENKTICQHVFVSSIAKTKASIDASSDVSSQSGKGVPMRPPVPPVTVLQSSCGPLAIPSKPPRSSVIIDTSPAALSECLNLTVEQSTSKSTDGFKIVSCASHGFQKNDSNENVSESISSIEKQPIPVKRHLTQGTLLSQRSSSDSVATHNPSASVSNQSGAKTSSSGDTAGLCSDVKANKSYQDSTSAVTPTQSIKTPISHPPRMLFGSPDTQPTVLLTYATADAKQNVSQNKDLPNSCKSTETSIFSGSGSNSAKVDSTGDSTTSLSLSKASNEHISFDNCKESDISLKLPVDTLPLAVNGTFMKPISEIGGKGVVHSGSHQQQSNMEMPTSIVLSKDKDEGNCASAELYIVSNLKSECENKILDVIQQPSVPPGTSVTVSKDVDGKGDLAIKILEPISEMKDGNSFGNKPPQIPKRPPGFEVSKENDAKSRISLKLKENMDLVLEENERLTLKKSARENPFNLSDKMTILKNEKSEELSGFDSGSFSLANNKIPQVDIGFSQKHHQSKDSGTHADVECHVTSKPTPSRRLVLKSKREAPSPPIHSSSSTWYVEVESSQFQNEIEEVQKCDLAKKSVSPVPLPRTKSKREIDSAPPGGESLPVSVSQQPSLLPKSSDSLKYVASPSERIPGAKSPPPRPTPPTAENMQRARKKITPDTVFNFEKQCFSFGPTSGDKKFSDAQELHMRVGAVVSSSRQPIVKRKVNAEDRLSSEYIASQLNFLDNELKKLEKDGRILEEKIRSGTDESMDDDGDKNILMTQWFEMINQKNELVRQESDLIYRCRQQELENKHEEVEFELRCLMNKPDNLKTATEKKREEMLLQTLLQTVSQRNSIIESIEEDRIRYLKEDEEIAHMLNSSPRV